MHPALKYAEQIAYSSKQVLHFTYEMSKKYSDIPEACYVECGCAAGAQIIALKAGAPFKIVYALDSWEGLPLPSNKDDQMPGLRFLSKEEQKALPDPGQQVLETTGAVAVPFEAYHEHVKNSGVNLVNIIPIKGWFEETVPKLSENIEPIAILRLDGDLYNSTYVCLKHLYPKVIKGGLVIIDDWALPGCRQAVVDYLVEIGIHAHAFEYIKDENSTVAYWTK
jgi:hypothetical protein